MKCQICGMSRKNDALCKCDVTAIGVLGKTRSLSTVKVFPLDDDISRYMFYSLSPYRLSRCYVTEGTRSETEEVRYVMPQLLTY